MNKTKVAPQNGGQPLLVLITLFANIDIRYNRISEQVEIFGNLKRSIDDILFSCWQDLQWISLYYN